MSNGQDALTPDDHNRGHFMDAWKTSEDVAMHFNGLLLGFRLKAIGGIAVGAVVTTGIKLSDLGDRALIASLFAGLAVIWILVWIADFCYYYRLLAGAVDELLRLERRLGNVHLSHLIERRVRGEGRPKPDIESILPYDANCAPTLPSWPIWVFYTVPTALLLWLAIYFKFCAPTI